VIIDIERCLNVRFEVSAAHGLTRFGSTNLNNMPTGGLGLKVVVETDYPVNFGAGYISDTDSGGR
jgi:hypothetical protein